jgi:HSP20 family molecular chaperone IbpA
LAYPQEHFGDLLLPVSVKRKSNNLGVYIMADALSVLPSICAYPDDKCENLQIEVVLPGVEKKYISFKISENGFYVKARKEGVNYLSNYSNDCSVIPENTVAKY